MTGAEKGPGKETNWLYAKEPGNVARIKQPIGFMAPPKTGNETNWLYAKEPGNIAGSNNFPLMKRSLQP